MTIAAAEIRVPGEPPVVADREPPTPGGGESATPFLTAHYDFVLQPVREL